MSYEYIAIVAIIICLIIMCVEFFWLYVLAGRQEAHIKKYDRAYLKIMNMFEAISTYPTEESLKSEIKSLKEFAGSDQIKMDIVCEKLLGLILQDDITEREQHAIFLVNEEIKPVEFYSSILRNGNAYLKAYSCRKIASYFGEDEIPIIRKLVVSNNKDLSYNAAMALASFGDEETVADFILKCQKNYYYSHRVILELIEEYTGDIKSLSEKVLARCDDYIKATVIKAIAPFKIEDFEEMYIKGLSNQNININVSCVKALGQFINPKYQHSLITSAHDKNWIVRLTAIKALEKIPSAESKQAVMLATSDGEWWVRYNAARSLVAMDKSMEYVEAVLGGYDKYAADVVKYVLYKTYNAAEEEGVAG